MSQHRWQRLNVEELREHFGDRSLNILKRLDPKKWQKVQHIKELAIKVVGKIGGAKFQGLEQSFEQSTSFYNTIENFTLWSTLAQTTKPGNAF